MVEKVIFLIWFTSKLALKKNPNPFLSGSSGRRLSLVSIVVNRRESATSQQTLVLIYSSEEWWIGAREVKCFAQWSDRDFNSRPLGCESHVYANYSTTEPLIKLNTTG